MLMQNSNPGTGRLVNTWLFPAEPRGFPYRRAVRTVLRAAHILTGGVLMGGYVFAVPEALLHTWWLGTMVTGLLLFLTDLHATLVILLEVRGLVVILKLLLVALVPWAGDAAPMLLAAALLIGAVSSHMPGRYRHRVLILRERVTPDERHG